MEKKTKKPTKKRQNQTERKIDKVKTEDVQGSDFAEEKNTFSDEVTKTFLGQFGAEVVKLAVNELRNEFKQMAKMGAEMALQGDNIDLLLREVENKEKEIYQLKKEKKELEDQCHTQKIKNEEMGLRISQLEREINLREKELENMRRLLKKNNNDMLREQESSQKRESELKKEIADLKQKYNNVKGKLLAKDASENVAKSELPKLRDKIAKLEEQLQTERVRKK